MKARNTITGVITNVILILISLSAIFPVILMISNSFKFPDDLFLNKIQLIPRAWTLDNYLFAWRDYDVPIWFINSVATTIGITLFQLILCVLAAYGLVFLKIRFKNILFAFFVASIVVPFQVTMIPNYILISKMGLINTWAGVILPNLANAFGIFLLRQFFLSFPYSLYEVAIIEGANSMEILLKIVLPISKTFIFALVILFFIDAWNLYFWPLLVMHTPDSKTLSIGLQQFIDYELGHRWGLFMATATLGCLPTIIIYIIMQKQIIATYSQSGIKG